MTTKQAIHLLHRLQDEQFDGQHGDERREALEMAVRALEGDGDTISRKMAIEAIEEMQMPIMRSKVESYLFKFSALAEVREMILELPSAQPEVLACRSGELVKESGDLVKDLVEDSSSDLISRQETIEYCVGNKTWHDEDRTTGDTISRKMAIDIVDIAKDLCPDAFGKGALKAVRDKLSELPPENTKRKKGKWEKGYFYGNVYRCSVCHEPIEIPYTYCPSCGAFMSPYIGKLQRGEHDG